MASASPVAVLRERLTAYVSAARRFGPDHDPAEVSRTRASFLSAAIEHLPGVLRQAERAGGEAAGG